MAAASWTIALGLVIVSAGGPSGRWLGQDGHDLVSWPPRFAKLNGYRDIHIRINNVSPPRDQVGRDSAGGRGIWSSVTSSNAWAIAVQRRETPQRLTFSSRASTPKKGAADAHQDRLPGRWLGRSRTSERSDRSESCGMPRLCPGFNGSDRMDRITRWPISALARMVTCRMHVSRCHEPSSKNEHRRSVARCGRGGRYRFGRNPEGDDNAELIKDAKDPTIGQLYFSAPSMISRGRTLTVTIFYPNSRRDTLHCQG